MKIISVLRSVFSSVFLLAVSASVSAEVVGLKVDNMISPVGIDNKTPGFSWQMKAPSGAKGMKQMSYRIVVTDESENTVWDSGIVQSSNSLSVPYRGAELKPRSLYNCIVTVTDNHGEQSSSATTFETGMLGGGWDNAVWIGGDGDKLPLYSPYLTVFSVDYTVGGTAPVAVFYFGANDPRMMSAHLNQFKIAADRDSSYYALRLDKSAVNKGGRAVMSVVRKNYVPEEKGEAVIARFEIPDSIISKKNVSKKHTVTFSCNLGYFDVGIDGVRIGNAGINPIGQGGDFLAFPSLSDVGYGADGGTAEFSDVKIRNFRYPRNVITGVPGRKVNGQHLFITPEQTSQPVLRTGFRVERPLKRARLYATARGIYDVSVNGCDMNSDYFRPGNSQYNRTHYYNTLDITPMLNQGDNTLYVTLGEGWWSGASTFMGDYWNFFGDRQSFMALLELTYTDGSKEVVITSPDTWEITDRTPLKCASFFNGEVFDSRIDISKSKWRRASEVPLEGTIASGDAGSYPDVSDYSSYRLTAHHGHGITAADTITAVSVSRIAPGVYVYDMGRNIAGVPVVRFSGLEPGQEVAMRYAEVLYPDLEKYSGNIGEMMMENIRAAISTDRYISSGKSEEMFSPRFTYHGYRYIEISGIDSPLPVEEVKSVILSSVNDFASGFDCSDSSVNQLWNNVKSSMSANFMSVPTDCPQRNERLGWSGDIEVFSPSALYLSDCGEFLRRHITALRDCQRPDGRFPDVAPTGVGFGGLLWGTAGITLPVECYLQYADTTFLTAHYDAMKRYIDYIEERCINPQTGILQQFYRWEDLSDWLGPEDEKNDKSLLWESYYIKSLGNMECAARVLGKSDDERRFADRKKERIAFFNDTYIDPVTRKTVFSSYDMNRTGKEVDTQTSYFLPVELGIIDAGSDSLFVGNMLASVRRENVANGSISCSPHSLMTGFIGTAIALPALTRSGATDDAYAMLLNHGYPSWLYSVDQGATTIWERLNSYTHVDGFGSNNRMNSFNHYSFGAVAKWLMASCIGIERRRDIPGFKAFNLRPCPDMRPEGMEYASGYYDSPYGRIESSWKKTGENICYEVVIPANTSATLYLPDGNVHELESGSYRFSTPLKF